MARQLGSARFRDLTGVRGRFSADSRWLVEYDHGRCDGYDLATGRCNVDPDLSVPVYPVRVTDGVVEVDLP